MIVLLSESRRMHISHDERLNMLFLKEALVGPTLRSDGGCNSTPIGIDPLKTIGTCILPEDLRIG